MAPTWHDLTLDERFWRNVDKCGPLVAEIPELGPCWLWTAAKNGNGYGAFSPGGGVTALAHRWIYERENGQIDSSLHLDHLCRRPACIRPSHLDPVPCRTNLMRSPIAPAAINAGKTHCNYGHEFTPENTRVYEDGHRECKACRRERTRRHHSRQRADQVAQEIEAGARLTADQESILRAWIQSGQALTLRESAGFSRAAAAQVLGVAKTALLSGFSQ